MEMVFQVVTICVVSSILALVLQKGSPELGLCLSLLTGVLVCVLLAEGLGKLMDFLEKLIRLSGTSQELFRPIYKLMGIGLVVRLGESLCRDAGDSALSAVVQTAGAVCGFLAALPLLESVLSLLLEMMP